MPTLIRAKYIAAMDRPILRDAAIVIDGEFIRAVGPAKDILHQYPRAEQLDLGNSILLPGLVNAHAHLELSMCRCGESPASFIDWILSMRSRVGDSPDFAAAALDGAAQSLRFGVTCVGDISQQCHLTRLALRQTPLRVVSYGEALGIGANRDKFDVLLDRALDRQSDPTAESSRLKIGISPHAPYSVEAPNYRKALAAARQNNLPLATHLAEQPYESEWLQHRTGPFRTALEKMNLWQDDINVHGTSPIQFAADIGLLEYPSLLAHVNHCDDSELKLLSAGRASVVYCPRTHRYFNHPPHRWRDMLAANINVALGTDSCASSPDLNLLDDLRLLRQIAPDASPELLWQTVTTNAARAVNQQNQIGSLTPGKFADFIAFEISTNDPLEELLRENCVPTHVWIAGDPVEKMTK
jgi:cytosine/adenosine deaminase-related metal-dependent hydrolase